MEKKLTESLDFKKSKIDRESRTIFGVAVLGKQSKHGYEYSDSALQEGVSFFEDSPVFLEHEEQKKVRNLAGQLRNLTIVNEQLRGDLQVTKAHENIIDLAENFPNQIGLSIMATGRAAKVNGKEIIEGFVPGRRRSVDLVIGPATVKNLFEQEDNMELKDLQEQVEALKAEKADLEKRLAEAEKPPQKVLNDDEKKLLEQVCDLEKRLEEQEKKTLEEQEKREKAERSALIDRKIQEAKIESTSAFRALLEKCDTEEEIEAAIEDRKRISPKRQIRSTPQDDNFKNLQEAVKKALS